jgi:hypothetical protein
MKNVLALWISTLTPTHSQRFSMLLDVSQLGLTAPQLGQVRSQGRLPIGQSMAPWRAGRCQKLLWEVIFYCF